MLLPHPTVQTAEHHVNSDVMKQLVFWSHSGSSWLLQFCSGWSAMVNHCSTATCTKCSCSTGIGTVGTWSVTSHPHCTGYQLSTASSSTGVVLLMYMAQNHLCPLYISQLPTPVSSTSVRRRLRSSGSSSFTVSSGPAFWNSIAEPISAANNILCFCKWGVTARGKLELSPLSLTFCSNSFCFEIWQLPLDYITVHH